MMKFIFFIIMLKICLLLFSNKYLNFYMTNIFMLLSLMFMMSVNWSFDWMLIYYRMGMDFLSFILILLSFWIMSMMFMVSYNIKFKKMFTMILLMLIIMLFMVFSSMNYFMFYLFFEISLIPVFMLIMGWGYQIERISASMYMMLYTMFASLPLMILIFKLMKFYKSLNYLILLNNFIFMLEYSFMIYLIMILSFLIKLPIFFFHIWLPKAHVEAPLSGSMILAGIMLKLGGYGIMRSMLMMINLSKNYNYLIMTICLFSLIVMSLVCLNQIDLKLLVAYSSIVHMAMMLMGLMTNSIWGYKGGYLMMIGHGLCSSGLFVLVNLLYERSKSRNLLINKGMIYYFPSLIMWWFMFCICNMSSPVSLNLISEVMIINTLINWSFNIIILLMISMLLSMIYSLYLFSYSCHGESSKLLIKLFNNNINNFMVLFYHWIPLNLLIIKMEMFM